MVVRASWPGKLTANTQKWRCAEQPRSPVRPRLETRPWPGRLPGRRLCPHPLTSVSTAWTATFQPRASCEVQFHEIGTLSETAKCTSCAQEKFGGRRKAVSEPRPGSVAQVTRLDRPRVSFRSCRAADTTGQPARPRCYVVRLTSRLGWRLSSRLLDLWGPLQFPDTSESLGSSPEGQPAALTSQIQAFILICPDGPQPPGSCRRASDDSLPEVWGR